MSTRSDLRTYVIERSLGICEWPRCQDPGGELAHIDGIKMGGRKSADRRGNVAWLCVDHHNRYDGRRPPTQGMVAALIAEFPPDDVICRWPGCRTPIWEMGLCYQHHIISDPMRVAPGRKAEMKAALAWWIETRRRALGEDI